MAVYRVLYSHIWPYMALYIGLQGPYMASWTLIWPPGSTQGPPGPSQTAYYLLRMSPGAAGAAPGPLCAHTRSEGRGVYPGW